MRNKLCLLLATILLIACGPVAIPGIPSAVNPQPGARLAGTIEMGDKAKSGEISFAVSEDGTSITDLAITLNDVQCDGLTAGLYGSYGSGHLALVKDGGFATSIRPIGGMIKDFKLDSPKPTATSDYPGAIEGRFSSPTEASGTITIFLGIPFSKMVCELGTFRWSARGD